MGHQTWPNGFAQLSGWVGGRAGSVLRVVGGVEGSPEGSRIAGGSNVLLREEACGGSAEDHRDILFHA